MENNRKIGGVDPHLFLDGAEGSVIPNKGRGADYLREAMNVRQYLRGDVEALFIVDFTGNSIPFPCQLPIDE